MLVDADAEAYAVPDTDADAVTPNISNTKHVRVCVCVGGVVGGGS